MINQKMNYFQTAESSTFCQLHYVKFSVILFIFLGDM